MPKKSIPCPKCGGDYCHEAYREGICRHCIPDRPAAPGSTLCEECAQDEQICPECGYPIES